MTRASLQWMVSPPAMNSKKTLPLQVVRTFAFPSWLNHCKKEPLNKATVLLENLVPLLNNGCLLWILWLSFLCTTTSASRFRSKMVMWFQQMACFVPNALPQLPLGMPLELKRSRVQWPHGPREFHGRALHPAKTFQQHHPIQ